MKQCHFASSLQTYLDMRWIPLLSIAITRAMWSSPRILCFMINQNTLRYGVEESSTCAVPFYTQEGRRCLHQTACQDKVRVLPWETWPGGECLCSWEGVLMIATSWDILQVVLLWTELRRFVRNPMWWVCHTPLDWVEMTCAVSFHAPLDWVEMTWDGLLSYSYGLN